MIKYNKDYYKSKKLNKIKKMEEKAKQFKESLQNI
jgi:hypothetical protein